MDPLVPTDFRRDRFFWVCDLVLPEWSGYTTGDPTVPAAPSDGRVELAFAPEGRGDAPLTDGEMALVNWFVRRHVEVGDAVLTAIFDAYPRIRADYAPASPAPEAATFLPPVTTPDDLRHVIAPGSVSVHQIVHGDAPYIGFGFECRWDVEHGLGVLVHGTRLVAVGMEDTAFLLWMARQDAERSM